MTGDAVRGRFLSQLAHDLRSPLNVIGSTLAELQRQPSELSLEEQTAMIQLASRSVARLLAVSDRLGIAGRLEQGEKELLVQLQPVDLNEVAQKAVAQFSNHEKRSRLELQTVWSAQPVKVLGDPVLLSQVVLELLSNANRTGRKSLRIEVAGGEHACVWVDDDGEGFPLDEQQLMFQAFVERRGRSLGLGLWLAHSLAGLHQGKISTQVSQLTPRTEGKPGARVGLQLPLMSAGTSTAG